MSHVIDFNTDGSAEAMHCDAFSLAFLGNQSIERATEIKFNEERQAWEIMLPDQNGNNLARVPFGGGFHSYEEARSVEVKWLNYCRLHSFDPQSTDGQNVMRLYRLVRGAL